MFVPLSKVFGEKESTIRIIATPFVLLMICISVASQSGGGGFQINSSVVAGGGCAPAAAGCVPSTGGNFSLEGTIGELGSPIPLNQPLFSLAPGFWNMGDAPVGGETTSLTAVSGAGVYKSSATLSATLTAGTAKLIGKFVSFTLNGNSVGTAITDSNGVAMISGVSLAGVNVGDYPNAVGAIFAGDPIYSSSHNTGPLAVGKATPMLTWNNPVAVVYGTPLGGSQLNAMATDPNDGSSIAGSFIYVPAVGTVLHAGDNQTLHVDFIPADTGQYNPSSKAVLINVTRAPLTVTADSKSKTYGGTNPPLTYTPAGFVNGETVSVLSGAPNLNTSAQIGSNAGSYPITITQGTLNSSDYGFSFVAGTMVIGKASTTTAVSSSVNPSEFGQSVTFTATVTSGAGTPTGTVQFKDGAANIDSPQPLIAGVAQLTTSSLTSGLHTITAEYSGDLNFVISTGTLSGGQTVNNQPTLSISDISVVEGNSGTANLVFTVNLSAASNLTVNVDYSTSNGTATTADNDYQSVTNTTITFNPTQTIKTITVLVNGDQKFEPDETVFVNLTNAVNAAVSDNQGLGTILNDDSLQLILDASGPDANQLLALESVLFVRDPFRVIRIAEWLNLGADQNTRVIVFAANLQLNQGETAADVVVNLIDGNSQSHNVTAEQVVPLPNSPFTQVIFRLPDTLSAGTCQVTISAHGQTTNTGTFRIVQ